MRNASWKRELMGRGLLLLVGLVLPAGCGPKNYKQDADERVYNIIDRKWEPQFGTRTNYRISDVEPDPNAIRIENAVPASGVLTLPYALALATAHNREYQTQKELLYTAALDLRLVRHGYETQLFGGGSALYRKNDQDEIVQTEANIGFNRLLAIGTQISTRVAVAWADVLAGTGDSGLRSIFSAAVSQPLLRGSDPRVVLETLTQAERNTLYQIRSFNRFRKIFVVAVATQYFQALELHDTVQNTQAYYDALAVLHRRVQKLVEVGLIPSLEADQIRQEMLKTSDVLIRAQKEYEQFLDQFKLTLALPMTAEFRIDASLLETLRRRGIPEPRLDLSDAVEAALSRRLDITNSADAVLDAQRAVYVAADSLRTDLRLTGVIDTDTRGNRKAVAGPILDLPLDRVPEQHAYRTALITLEQRRRDYDLLADTVRLEVRDAYRKLVEAAERYDGLSKQLDLAQARLKRTLALMHYGRASSRRVLDAQEDLYDAHNAATDALTDYAIATLNFYRDTDALQVRPDGMWQDGPGIPVPSVRTTANTSTVVR